MSSSNPLFDTTKIPLLTNTNYHTWIVTARAILRQKKLWEVCQTDTESPRQIDAADILTLRISPEVAVKIREEEFNSGYLLLNRLKLLFQPLTETQFMRDSLSLYSLRLGKNPEDFLTEIKLLDERIEASKIELTRDKRVLLALTLGISSDPSFQSLIQLWLITPNLTSDQAISMFREELLRREVTSLKEGEPVPEEKSLVASRKRKRGSNKRQEHKREREESSSDSEDSTRCRKCKKGGHEEEDCWRDILCKNCRKRGHPTEKCWRRDDERDTRAERETKAHWATTGHISDATRISDVL